MKSLKSFKSYEVRTKSGDEITFTTADEMESLMRDENDLELLESDGMSPIQFNIVKDIETIRNMKPGAVWRHALAVVKCVDKLN